jgi:small conductance mechanosensitive channel
MTRLAAPDAADAAGFLSGLSVWSIVFAIVAVVAGIVAGIFAKRGTLALLAKVGGLSTNARIRIARTVRLTLILLGVGIAIAFLGAPVQPVIALALIVAVIAVLALRGVSENFAAGIVLQTRRPFIVGEAVDIDGHTGTVRELNGRSVAIDTADGRVVHVPNSVVLGSTFVNDSQRGGRRSQVEARIRRSPSETPADLAELVATACAGTTGVRQREPVRVLVDAVEPKRVTLRVQFWHHPEHGSTVRSSVVEALAEKLSDRDATVTARPAGPPVTPPAAV